ncbi:MAG: dipeptidase [Phycisphaerales bacterium]|nr:dipeptidase [Phycisphaerales bacterium]
MTWFDAHLDLAYLAELGRDLHAPVESCRGSLLPAAVTLPELREARVGALLGTIFTEGMTPEAFRAAQSPAYAYCFGDALGAWKAGQRQLRLYQAWREAGLIAIMPPRGVPGAPCAESRPPAGVPAPAARPFAEPPITLGILMECADPIESPEQADEWAEAGVIAVGMAWAVQGRYAGGNTTTSGLTDLGRALVERLDGLGVVHDASHLSDQSLADLFSATPRPVIASHSNCRALVGGRNQRHLTDEAVAEIARRGGVIGLNLLKDFIRPGYERGNPRSRPSIAMTIDHVEHVCAIAGHRRGVGLGSDFDGGITAHDLPEGMTRARDLHLLAEELRRRGWSDDDVHGFAWANWARFWGLDARVA